MGFGFTHTCCFYGGSTGKKSFDSGHAFCTGGGENAEFRKWIGPLTCKSNSVQYILRLKDRAHYRVQAGAFTDIRVFNQEAARLKQAGFPVTQITEDGMYKIQCGYFSGKSNANRLRDQLIAKGFGAFVKEV
jgi:cell division protein FtsN